MLTCYHVARGNMLSKAGASEELVEKVEESRQPSISLMH